MHPIRRIKQYLLATVAILSLALTLGLTTASTASADSNVSFSIDVTNACQEQYDNNQAYAGYTSPFDANSWECRVNTGGSFSYNATLDKTGLGASAEYQSTYAILGGVNLNTWCAHHHPNTFAVVDSQFGLPNAFAWVCWAR